jgi:hypothetical protein
VVIAYALNHATDRLPLGLLRQPDLQGPPRNGSINFVGVDQFQTGGVDQAALDGLVAGQSPPLVVLGILVAAVQESRDTIMRAATVPGDPAEKATLLSQGFSGTINALSYGSLPIMLLVALGGVAAPLAVAARLRARGLARAVVLAPAAPDGAVAWAQHPGPDPGALVGTVLAFLALGLGPILRSALVVIAARVKFFGAILDADPGLKAQLFLQHLDESAAQMKQGLVMARVGLAVATAVALLLTIAGSPRRARARILGRAEEASGNGAVVLGVVFLVLAGAAIAAARPLQRENDLPWPPVDPKAVPVAVDTETPAFDGPDVVERAPILVVSAGGLELDGRPMELATLGQTLGTLHSNYLLLHPGQDTFNGILLVACTPETTGARLLPVLSQALQGGYDRPMLLFVRRQATERPLLGPRSRTLASGAAFNLVTAATRAEEGSTILDRNQLTTCRDLGTRLVALRRQGKNVALVMNR